MKEFIEKLIGRLEEVKKAKVLKVDGKPYGSMTQLWRVFGINEAIIIVNQLAEEYINCSTDTSTDTSTDSHRNTDLVIDSSHSNGWIPCSERLPDTEHISGVSETVLVTTNNNSIFTAEYHGNGKWLDDVADWSLEVIAWQPLPQAYQPKGE